MVSEFEKMFDFRGQSIVITGGAGVLCSEMVKGLVNYGANVSVLDFNLQAAQELADSLNQTDNPGESLAVKCNVLDVNSIKEATNAVLQKFGRIDALINGAGGNKPDASTNETRSFFELSPEALRWVFDLNILGTILPSQVIGEHMASRKQGVILNISSMNAFRPLTRIPAYSAAKAGTSNFTQWLAVHMAQEYSPEIRVNAIAPGFFVTDQNRFLLIDKETGELSPRGRKIIDHTPMARFGEPVDLLGTTLWLLSPAAKFVTGIVVPIDGGFSAYSGV